MKIKKFKTAKEVKKELLESKKSVIFFCNFCNILFEQMRGYSYNPDKETFTCSECYNPEFKHSDYIKVANKQYKERDFHINGNNDVMYTDVFISKIIKELREEGLTLNEIISVTHFPDRLVRRLHKQFEFKTQEYSVNIFLSNELKIDSTLVDAIIQNKRINPIDESDFVTKALKYGCSTKFISDLFCIRKSKVITANKILKFSDDILMKQNIAFIKNSCTIKLQDNTVIIIPKYK